MLESLAKHYLSYRLRKGKIHNIEIVIRPDGWTYNTRDKDKEESIKRTMEITK